MTNNLITFVLLVFASLIPMSVQLHSCIHDTPRGTWTFAASPLLQVTLTDNLLFTGAQSVL